VVGDCFGQHSLPAARRSVHENTARRVDTNLLVEIKVSERQLNGLSHFLFLNVHPTDIRIGDVGFFIFNKTDMKL